ncbi:hypothetical protein HanIR_Chr09g0393341 [Helianthus annuus]|nr:hypothetical protein HanIR_Chr09g0393341 [Helianthus annuus]
MIPLTWSPVLNTWCERRWVKGNRLMLRLRVSPQRRSSGRKLPEVPVSHVPIEPQSVVNEELPPSPPRASVADQLDTMDVPDGGVEKTVEVDKHVDVDVEVEKAVSPGVVDGVGNPRTPEIVAQDLEKEKTAEKTPASTFSPKPSDVLPERVEKVTVEEQGSFSGAGKNSPIRQEETLGDYYYRTYSEKDASELHAPIWNLKKGDTFSDWRVRQDWLQGIFPPGEIKFQESRLHE